MSILNTTDLAIFLTTSRWPLLLWTRTFEQEDGPRSQATLAVAHVLVRIKDVCAFPLDSRRLDYPETIAHPRVTYPDQEKMADFMLIVERTKKEAPLRGA